MTNASFSTIILAAGKGTRMRSNLPKVLHQIASKPMIVHVMTSVAALSPEKIVTVIAPHMDSVKEACSKAFAGSEFAEQAEQKGTGHAVKCALDALKNAEGDILVVYGDTPLVQSETLATLLAEKKKHNATIALLGIHPDDPTGYGRLVMKQEPFVDHIVECKDATPEQKNIRWGWGGVMAFDADFVKQALPNVAPSPATGEYYLTSLLEMATAKGGKNLMVPMSVEEAMGVNDRTQLAEAESVIQTRLRKRAMINGATLIDPASVFFSADTHLGSDVLVHPFVVFGPGVTVGNNVEIRSYSHLEKTIVKDGATLGPFARLRPGTEIGEGSHVGNFVELKNTKLAKGAKANHLSYIGDSDVGANANIGAGTITCNYDGVNKYKTTIGEGAFIGSNSSLVAPVTIGNGAIIGAGSVITGDVENGALALTRAPQVVKPGKATEMKSRKKKG